MSDVTEDERLRHIQDVIQHHMLCCIVLENLQTIHTMLYKSCQQAQLLTWMPKPVRLQLEQTCKEHASLMQAVAEHNFFFRPTPYGFRQVVQHVSKHVAYGIN